MLSVLALEHAGLNPSRGDVVVIGANGGVGPVAIAILSKLGYRVVASTKRLEEEEYLRVLDATEIIDRRTLSEPGSPIAQEKWAGAVDSVGSHTLVNLLAQTQYCGDLRTCSRCRPSWIGPPVHLPERHAGWDRLRKRGQGGPAGGVVTPRARSRPR
jgi:acrylyl-CoA reductase (NADPH)